MWKPAGLPTERTTIRSRGQQREAPSLAGVASTSARAYTTKVFISRSPERVLNDGCQPRSLTLVLSALLAQLPHEPTSAEGAAAEPARLQVPTVVTTLPKGINLGYWRFDTNTLLYEIPPRGGLKKPCRKPSTGWLRYCRWCHSRRRCHSALGFVQG